MTQRGLAISTFSIPQQRSRYLEQLYQNHVPNDEGPSWDSGILCVMLPLYKRQSTPPAKCLRVRCVVPILLFLTVIIALFLAMGEDTFNRPRPENGRPQVHFRYTAQTNYFLQSLPSTDPSSFDPTMTDFGLISRSYDSDRYQTPASASTNWQRFVSHVEALNIDAPADTTYHLLFLTRHGQGFHNLAETYYGTEAWDCYYAALEGDSKSSITWADAHLSKLGQGQARDFAKFWKKQHAEQGTPIPGAWFVSPLDRAIQTADILIDGVLGADSRTLQPLIKEKLREEIGIHTCDRRSTRSEIRERWGKKFALEDNLTEKDELWQSDIRETKEAHTRRATLLLDEVFADQEVPMHVAMTAHGGAVNAILRAVRHREFILGTGSGMPLLLKVERLEGRRPEGGPLEPGEGAPACVNDPLKAGLPGYKDFKDYVDASERLHEKINAMGG